LTTGIRTVVEQILGTSVIPARPRPEPAKNVAKPSRARISPADVYAQVAPGEWLTVADVAERIGATAKAARYHLTQLVRGGFLESCRLAESPMKRYRRAGR